MTVPILAQSSSLHSPCMRLGPVRALFHPCLQVAVVGNGPLAEAQRDDIAQAACIVRFNQLENREPGERTDLWIVSCAAHTGQDECDLAHTGQEWRSARLN